MAKITISEEELHAYLDGELPTSRCDAVETYLREHPQEARRLEEYRRDGEAITRLFSRQPISIEPVRPVSTQADPRFSRRHPGSNQSVFRTPVPRDFVWKRPVWRSPVWRNMAAGLLIFAMGSAAGWFGHDRAGAASMQRLGYQAETAYLLLGESGTEVRPPDLSDAVTKALGLRMNLRDTNGSGMSLTGARIVQHPNGPAVQFAFKGLRGEVVTMYFERRPGATETSFYRLAGDGITTLVWEDDNLGCAITGPMSPDALENIARWLYKSLLS